MISVSSKASPGAFITFGSKVIRLSELVKTESFSAQAAAGSTTSAYLTVSERLEISWTTTNLAFCKPFSTIFKSGKLTIGLVVIIQIAFIRPSARAWNISVAVKPGLSEIFVPPQNA